MQHTADFLVTANHRVKFSLARHVVQILRILVQRIVCLLIGSAVHFAALVQLGDGALQSLLSHAGIFQNLRATVIGHEDTIKQMFKRDKLVTGILAEDDGFLHGGLCASRKIEVTARNLGQMSYLTIHDRGNRFRVTILLLQQEGYHIIVHIQHGLQQMQ